MKSAKSAKALNVARFVRDAHAQDRNEMRVVHRFGADALKLAIELGYVERQKWAGEETDILDLTAAGDKALCEAALADPVEQELQRILQQTREMKAAGWKPTNDKSYRGRGLAGRIGSC